MTLCTISALDLGFASSAGADFFHYSSFFCLAVWSLDFVCARLSISALSLGSTMLDRRYVILLLVLSCLPGKLKLTSNLINLT